MNRGARGRRHAARAKHYGLTVEQYKKNNVLKTEVTSRAGAGGWWE